MNGKEVDTGTEGREVPLKGSDAWTLLKTVVGEELKQKLQHIHITGLAYHSADVERGALFFACPGRRATGMIIPSKRYAGVRQP